MKRALVMSGGGGKGAYQFGVWKALRKLNIDFDIVTGTSIGALNGALIVQDDYLSLWYLWEKANFDTIFGYKMKNNIDSPLGKKETINMYKEGILKDKGMDTIHIEKLAERFISEKKIRNSKMDYGIVTFNLTDFKVKTLSKKQIPAGKLIDYAIASATCFPAFKIKEIDGDQYIDGGYYDNMPINLAIDMGAEEIIAVDLRAFGIMQKVKNRKVKVITITPHNNLGSFLIFDKKISRRNIKYGYNDTMKKFGYLDGKAFTFKKGDLKENYDFYINKLKEVIFSTIGGKKSLNNLILDSNINLILNNHKNKFDNIIEFLGDIYDLDDSKIYKIELYNKALKRSIKEDIVDGSNIFEKDLLSIKGKVSKGVNRQIISYFYKNNDLNNLVARRLALLFPKQFVASLYLKVIK